MRLLIKLKSKIKTKIVFPYYLQIQGLIYNFLKNTEFEKIHNKKSYKFFCFSNIFSEENFHSEFIERNQFYNLIISSPNKDFLKTLGQSFIKKEEIKIGQAEFALREIKFFNLNVEKNIELTSTSPIIIRIPREKYDEYKIFPKSPYSFLFWRSQYPLEVFIKQLEANIFKKYKEFFRKNIEEFPIFQKFIFKKSVSIPLKIHNWEVNYIGSVWEFHFDFLDKRTKEILKFAIDCGFGEKNSMGFGFVNIKKK